MDFVCHGVGSIWFGEDITDNSKIREKSRKSPLRQKRTGGRNGISRLTTKMGMCGSGGAA